MKNLNSLLVRLGALSLAATMIFSAADAATTARKDPKAAAAVISALVAQTAGDASRALTQGTSSDTFNKNVVIGTASANNTLTVYGDTRIDGDVVAGHIAADNTTAGRKHLIGIQTMDPRTQQFKILFKDKTKASHGAFVNLDFVTTVTSYRLGVADVGVATNFVQVPHLYVHPQMTSQRIMGRAIAASTSMKSTTTSFVLNGPALTEARDFKLTPTIRVEAITQDICVGFVPNAQYTYPVATFYDPTLWAAVTTHPTWSTGILSYQVASDGVKSVEVVSSVTDDLTTLDVFELFTDTELAELLAALKEYFGEDTVKMREYLMAHRHQLSRAFKALRA